MTQGVLKELSTDTANMRTTTSTIIKAVCPVSLAELWAIMYNSDDYKLTLEAQFLLQSLKIP